MIVHCIDTETTGLYPEQGHEIIEIGIVTAHVKLDGKKSRVTVLDDWATKIKPICIAAANPEALRINGYCPDKWTGAPYWASVTELIQHHTREGLIIGWNVQFDLKFINSYFNTPLVSNRSLDVMSMAHAILGPLGQKSMSLSATRKTFGINPYGAHTALKDARDTVEIYRRLLSMTWLEQCRIKYHLSRQLK